MSEKSGGEPSLAQREVTPGLDASPARGSVSGGTTEVAVAALAGLAALAAVASDALPWLRGPAPYPPEWQWGWRAEAGRPLVLAGLVAVALVLLVATAGGRWWRARPRVGAAALLAAATVGGLSFAVALLEREPAGSLRALMARAQSFSVTSYHSVAVSGEARDPLAFLRAHAGLLPGFVGTAKHAATHPPGPVLWYRAAVGLCASSPALTGALLGAAEAPGPQSQPPERRAARAGALLGALGLALLAALTVWPLAWLGEGLGLERLDAARVAAVFVLLPGPALFAGSLDAALALPVTACAALLLASARETRARRAVLSAAAAGALAAVALFGSYGSAAFLALAGLAVAAAAVRDRPSLARFARAGAVTGAVALALAFALPALLGHEPVRAARTALALHHAEYTAPRSYFLWLAFNPLDFALFAGLPFALLAAWRATVSLGRSARRTSLDRYRGAAIAGLVALVASGVTRGEVGRLWMPLVPLLLLSSARDDEPAGLVPTLVPAAIAAAFTIAIASRWSF
jgi:hypothetical protein